VRREIEARLSFLVEVGLGYLSLDRESGTLSGGEAQRIRLATQIGSGLAGCLYVLDEPSIGLHQRDNDRLIGTLRRLRDLGNTVIVVEHDEDTIREADHIIDLGPGAGARGGHIVAQGSLADILAVEDSLTAQYLSGRAKIPVPKAPYRAASKCVVEDYGCAREQPARTDRGVSARLSDLRDRSFRGAAKSDAGR
jgi:excinuclease ABC subunit A